MSWRSIARARGPHCGTAGYCFVLAALVTVTPVTALAEDGLAACGNIYVGLQAACEVEPPGVTCETLCSKPTVRRSCAARMTTECRPECTATVVETEVQVCSNRCVTECNVDPGGFKCSASCNASCTASCGSKCSASSDRARCEASCQATCSGYCGVECKVVLPTASCEQRCRPSCVGVKKAEVNMDCQIACHTKKYTVCEDRVVQDCVTDCRGQEGALFCEGQFVDHGDNLQSCIDALKNFEISVDFAASVSVSGCAVSAPGAPRSAAPGWLALVFIALAPLSRLRGKRDDRS